MATQYLTAKFGGVALPEESMRRMEICMGCEYRVVKDDLFYCRECSCPQTKFWPDSELRKKTTFDRAVCPKHKW